VSRLLRVAAHKHFLSSQRLDLKSKALAAGSSKAANLKKKQLRNKNNCLSSYRCPRINFNESVLFGKGENRDSRLGKNGDCGNFLFASSKQTLLHRNNSLSKKKK
jgi:hypothetical protein